MLSSRSQGLLASIAFILLALISHNSFFFSADQWPWWDFAANDPLIKWAKQFELLHGNYSRVGFYHPGPFYLYLSAFTELVFHDWTPIFLSPIAAQFFASVLFSAGMIGLLWWLGAEIKGVVGGFILCALTISIGFRYSPLFFNFYYFEALGNFLISLWPPHLYMVTSIYLTIAVIALFMRGPQWWPLIIFCLFQLMHGHASFLLLAPFLGIVVFAAHCWHMRQMPLRYLCIHRRAFYLSLPIIAVMLWPLIAQLIWHWPGQFGAYLAYAQKPSTMNHADAFPLFFYTMPLPLISAALLFVMRKANMNIAFATWFIAITSAVWIYLLNGVDGGRYAYVIFWYSAMLAVLLAIQLLCWLKDEPKLLPILLIGSGLLLGSSWEFFRPFTAQRYNEHAYDHAMEKLNYIAQERGTLSLYLAKETIYVPMDIMLHLLVRMRAENQPIPFCFGPGSWNPMFLAETKCTTEQAKHNPVLITHDALPYDALATVPMVQFYDMRGHETAMQSLILHPGERSNYMTALP